MGSVIMEEDRQEALALLAKSYMGVPWACIVAGSKSNPERLMMNSWMMFSKGAIWRSLFVRRRVDLTGMNVPVACRRLLVGLASPEIEGKK